VPPHLHRQNAAEQSIQTFKNHFVAGLCSVDTQFPLHLWCEILLKATLTLNLLRTSRINPTISAATQLYRQFDFNRTPLPPPGTRAVAHVKPKARRSWAPHGEDTWYVGPDPDHYRCYKVWMVAWTLWIFSPACKNATSILSKNGDPSSSRTNVSLAQLSAGSAIRPTRISAT
jgi:hypothetical protein